MVSAIWSLPRILGSVVRNQLMRVIGSAEVQHHEISAALDMLFTGI
jgi:hypothetical protein